MSDFRPGQVCRGGWKRQPTVNDEFNYFWVRFNEDGSADVWLLSGPKIPAEAVPVTAPESADHLFNRFVTRFEGGWVGVGLPTFGRSGFMIEMNYQARAFNIKGGRPLPLECAPP